MAYHAYTLGMHCNGPAAAAAGEGMVGVTMVKSTNGVAQTCGRLQDGHRPLCGVVRVSGDPVWLSTRLYTADTIEGELCSPWS